MGSLAFYYLGEGGVVSSASYMQVRTGDLFNTFACFPSMTHFLLLGRCCPPSPLMLDTNLSTFSSCLN